MKPCGRNQSGVTLVELMVAIVIMSIIVGVTAEAIVLGLRTVESSQARLTESIGVAFASAYFVPDVESAGSVAAASATGCPVSGTAVARFAWQDTGGERIATYGVRDHDGERALVRQFCVAGAAQGEIVLVRTISAATIVPTCDGSPCSATPSTPASVGLTLNFESGRTVDLTASRRSQ